MMLIAALLILFILGAYLWWDRSSLYVAAAHRAFRRGDEDDTLVAFAKAETAGRLDADTTASYAYLALKHGRTDEAGVVLGRALAHGRRGKPLKEPERRLLGTYQALVLWKQGDGAGAVSLLEDLLAQGYRTAALYGNLGFFLLELGKLDRAEEVCLEAFEWDPEGKVILDNLASLYLRREDWTRAAEVYGRLLALEPRFPEAWWGAGQAALNLRDPEAARNYWTRALDFPFNALTTVEKSAIEDALALLNGNEDPGVLNRG